MTPGESLLVFLCTVQNERTVEKLGSRLVEIEMFTNELTEWKLSAILCNTFALKAFITIFIYLCTAKTQTF